MPSNITTGQVDRDGFSTFVHERVLGSATNTSGFYKYSNPLNFRSTESIVVDSGIIMTRASGLSSQLSGTLDASGKLLFGKAEDVSGHAETFTTTASGFLQTEIETSSGQFSTTSGDFLKSGSSYNELSGSFSLTAPTGALAYSKQEQGLFIATGSTTLREGWMKLSSYPEMTSYTAAASGDIRTSLNTTGTNLTTSISNVLSDSSTNFSAKKTFSAGIKTSLIDLDGSTTDTAGVTLRVNSNDSVTFDDANGALLTLSPGYGSDAPVFSVTDKAGLPLVDVYDDDRLNFGPYGTNPLNISGERVFFGNYKSYISGTTIHFSGNPLTINNVFEVSGISGGYVFLKGLPEWPNIGGLNSGAVFRSGNAGAGPSVLCVV